MTLFCLLGDKNYLSLLKIWTDDQGAIMAVGASKPTVVADADGFFSVKSKMLVSMDTILLKFMPCFFIFDALIYWSSIRIYISNFTPF